MTKFAAPSSALRWTLACTFALIGPAAMSAPIQADFSYDFGSGNKLTGSVIGTYQDQGNANASDDYIGSITSISLSMNGHAYRGPLHLSAYSNGRRDDLESRLYLDVGYNNNVGFIIANCVDLADCIAHSVAQDYNYFVLRAGSTPYANAYDNISVGGFNYEGNSGYGSPYWQISTHAVANPPGGPSVPEPTSAALALLGLVGAVSTRRRST